MLLASGPWLVLGEDPREGWCDIMGRRLPGGTKSYRGARNRDFGVQRAMFNRDFTVLNLIFFIYEMYTPA